MGSASREALAKATKGITPLIEASAGPELLGVSAQLEDQPGLAAALGDASASADSKVQLADRVFTGLSIGSRGVLAEAISGRWSTVDEFIEGIAEIGVRAASATSEILDEELLEIANVIDSSHELELALGSKLGSTDTKLSALKKLLNGKVSDNAAAIAEHTVAYPRGRRVSSALRRAAQVAAEQQGKLLALVTVASSLDQARQERLQAALSRTSGAPVKVSYVVDPEVLGGIRVQIADEIIDGSVRRRLDDLRLQLAG
ncbi:MAG: ATP synthase F1 subunit delta [Canibacter sp.]